MRYIVRQSAFETNSSSTHALVVLSDDEVAAWREPGAYIDLSGFEYWDFFDSPYTLAELENPEWSGYHEGLDAVAFHPYVGVVGDRRWSELKGRFYEEDASTAEMIARTDLLENPDWQAKYERLLDEGHLEETDEEVFIRAIQAGFVPFLEGDYYVFCERSHDYYQDSQPEEFDADGSQVWQVSRGADGHNYYGGD